MPSSLSASEWKKVLKANPAVADGAALTRALEDYARAEAKDDPAAVLEALEYVDVAARLAKKKNAKAPKIVDFLDDLLKESAGARKEAEADKKEQEDGDDEGPGYDIKKFLKRARAATPDSALPFVYAPAKKLGGLVIARSISAKHKKLAREVREQNVGKKVSGTRVFEGICYGRATGDEAEDDEKGKFVFQLETNPRSGMAKALALTLLKQGGKRFKVKVKGPQGEIDDETDADEMDVEEGGEEGEEEGKDDAQAGGVGESEAPAGPGEAWAREVAELEPLYLKGLRDLPDKASSMRAIWSFAEEKGRIRDYTAAFAATDRLRKLLGLPPVPPPPPKAQAGTGRTAEAPSPELAAFQRRVDELTPDVKAALQRKGPEAQDVKLRFSEANVFARKADFPRAGALLDEVESLLGRTKGGAKGDGDGAEPKQQFLARARAVKAELDRLAATDPGAATPLRTAYATALGHGQAERYAQALELLGDVAQKTETALAAGGAKAAAADGKGADAGKASGGMAAWTAAREEVVKQLRKAAGGYSTSKNPYAREAIIEIQSIIANLTPKPATPEAVAELRRYLHEDDVIDAAEDIPSDIATVVIRKPLLAALDALNA